MSTLKKSAPVSTKLATKPAAPVTAKRIVSKPLLKKPVVAPAKRALTTTKPVPATKPVSTAKPVSAAKPTAPLSTAKEVKIKKPKLVRDSFTIPKAEYVVLEALKERAVKLSRAAKKSELLRAGIKALAAMSDAAFLSALTAVPTIKTGRPAAAN